MRTLQDAHGPLPFGAEFLPVGIYEIDMKIRFFGPFADAIGKEAVIDLKQDTAFRDIIDMLRDRYDVLSPYLSDVKSDEELSYRIVFLKKGMPLKLDETVRNDDTIQVLLPVTGG